MRRRAIEVAPPTIVIGQRQSNSRDGWRRDAWRDLSPPAGVG